MVARRSVGCPIRGPRDFRAGRTREARARRTVRPRIVGRAIGCLFGHCGSLRLDQSQNGGCRLGEGRRQRGERNAAVHARITNSPRVRSSRIELLLKRHIEYIFLLSTKRHLRCINNP